MDDYSEINGIEAGCDFFPVDYPDFEKGLALAAVANEHRQEDDQHAYYRRVKMSKVCEEWQRNNPRDDVSFRSYVASQFGADVDDEYVYQPLGDEFGFSQYVLENDLGKLIVKGGSRVFRKKEC